MRNPKMHPERGDILRYGQRERHVIGVAERAYTMRRALAVDYLDVRKAGTTPRTCTLKHWQKWASHVAVSVVQVGAE